MDAKLTGKIIADRRKAKGLNQIQLGEALNVSNRTVSKWENGDGYPDITLLPDISRVLDISIDELLTGERHIKSNVDKDIINNYKIMLVLSFFLATFSALLGGITELYNFIAFQYILFYNHWEIMFAAVSLGTTVISVAILVIGILRLNLSYSAKEIVRLSKKPAAVLCAIISVFPLTFILRVIALNVKMLTYEAVIITAVIAVITAAIIYMVYKRVGGKYEN